MIRRSLALLFVAACGGGGGFPDAGPPDAAETGRFSLAWSVVDQDNAPLACDRIAAQSMTVLTHNKEFEGGSTEIFTCKDGEGTSEAVLAGTYDLDFELAGTFGTLARGAEQKNVVVPPDGTVQLDPVTFQVKALGGMALELSSGASGGNCAATGANGAGITSFTITMNHTGDQTCAPLTLNISAGANQGASTYTINCTTPVVAGCIENDQIITASGVDSDGYTLHIKGTSGADCYLNDDMVQVPPLDLVLSRTLNLVMQTGGACGP
jgi:hypothetical protein